MTSRVRYALIAFATLGLGAALAALYVHYRLLTDPTYSSFCDISETVSCQQVFQSPYATVLGVPVAAGGAIWSALVLLLTTWGMRPKSDAASRVAGYVFVLATLGLAAVFYFAYVSLFILHSACPLCITIYVSVVAIFLISAGAAGPLRSLPSRLGPDFVAIWRSPLPAIMTVVWLIASGAIVLGFPRERTVSASEVSSGPQTPPVPIETLTPEQVAEWEKWLAAQPRSAEAQPKPPAKVLVIKFNDYQCPSCRLTWSLYKDIFAKYEASNPGVFVYETHDYPLETECGMGGVHGAACEAAAAVRMAKEKNRGKELEAALFARQSPTMTRDDVKSALREVAQISESDFDARYAKVLEGVRADAQLGQKLGVKGTPTFFLNGINLPTVRPAYMDAAIQWALRSAGAGS